MPARYDFNGTIPKDRCLTNLTVQCQNSCLRSQGLPPQDYICENSFIQEKLNTCMSSENISTLTDEQWDAYRQASMRIYSALYQQCQAQNTSFVNNGDEINIPSYIGMFSKTLPHDSEGRVTPTAYETLRDAINTRDKLLLNSVPNPGTTKLVQPLASFLTNIVGPAPSSLPLSAAPSFSSSESAAEMVEVYCKALCRDIPFVSYGTDTVVGNCVGYLNALSSYTGNTPVTTSNIFRGVGQGDLIGPFLSQFLYLDTPLWPSNVSSTFLFPTRSATNNRMITETNYLSVQNGTVLELGPIISMTPTYMSTGRDLAYCVWQDMPGQLVDLAVRKAIYAGVPLSAQNPYSNVPLNANQDAFVTWSVGDCVTLIYDAAQVALSAAWYNKWVVNRRLRPEAFGNEVEQVRISSNNPGSIHADLLTSNVLADIFTMNSGNHYLPQVFPEGSPSHPSYPAGHAVIAGACITIAKAFLQDDFVLPNPVVPADATGTTLTAYVGPDLIVCNEFNKLASNIALGRDWAGVHYRSDGHEGILLGEQIAILMLQDWINRYVEENVSFSFTGYLGNIIMIFPQHVYSSDIVNPGTITNVFQGPSCCNSQT